MKQKITGENAHGDIFLRLKIQILIFSYVQETMDC